MGTLLAILGAIPGIGQVVSFVVGKMYDSKVAIETAKLGGDRDVAISNLTTRAAALATIATSPLLTFLVLAFALPLVVFIWKIVAWDVVVGSFYGCVGVTAKLAQCATFSTDPIRGQAADWANSIIWAVFGSSVVAHFARGGK